MYTPLLSNGLTQINPLDNGSFIAKCSHLSPARRTGAPHMGSAWFLPPPPSHTTEQTPVPMINILRLVRCVPSLCLSASPPLHPLTSIILPCRPRFVFTQEDAFYLAALTHRVRVSCAPSPTRQGLTLCLRG